MKWSKIFRYILVISSSPLWFTSSNNVFTLLSYCLCSSNCFFCMFLLIMGVDHSALYKSHIFSPHQLFICPRWLRHKSLTSRRSNNLESGKHTSHYTWMETPILTEGILVCGVPEEEATTSGEQENVFIDLTLNPCLWEWTRVF